MARRTLSEILLSHQTRRPVIMGILNVTPDSFSDGGRFFSPSSAINQAGRMLAEGADIIDVGAESTRPGARRVGPQEQIDRLREVLPALAQTGVTLSVDTTSAATAAFALDAGATMVNDISAGREDADLLPLVAERRCGLVLMHMQGEPATMQLSPHYDDVVREVREFLAARIQAAVDAGISPQRLMVDPGIGFGKTVEHNLQLLAGLEEIASLSCPVLVGVSRKRFLGELTGRSQASQRDVGSVAACLAAWRRGATIFRVHEPAPLVDALKVTGAIESACGERISR